MTRKIFGMKLMLLTALPLMGGCGSSITRGADGSGSGSVEITFAIPTASALVLKGVATTPGEGLTVQCEDFDGNLVGEPCTTDASGTCTVEGLTSDEMEAGFVCVGDNNGIPLYALVFPTDEEIASETPVAATVDPQSSYVYAVVRGACPDGIGSCGETDLEALADGISSLLEDESEGASDALFEEYYEALLAASSGEDPTEFLSGALAGGEAGDYSAGYIETVSEVTEAIGQGGDPESVDTGGSQSSTDADPDYATIFNGTCSTPAPDYGPLSEGQTVNYNWFYEGSQTIDGLSPEEAAAGADCLATVGYENGETGCMTTTSIMEACEGECGQYCDSEGSEGAFLLMGEVGSANLSGGEDWEGQKKLTYWFSSDVDTGATTATVRYKYTDVTGTPMLGVVMNNASFDAVTVIDYNDDTDNDILCEVFAFEDNQSYRMIVIGTSGVVHVTWMIGDTCNDLWPSE